MPLRLLGITWGLPRSVRSSWLRVEQFGIEGFKARLVMMVVVEWHP